MPPPCPERHGRLHIVIAGAAASAGTCSESAVRPGLVENCESVAFRFRNIEAGIAHAEWLVNVIANEVGQRLIRELFDDVALNVHRHAVGPAFAGLIEERNLRKLVDKVLQVFRREKIGIA